MKNLKVVTTLLLSALFAEGVAQDLNSSTWENVEYSGHVIDREENSCVKYGDELIFLGGRGVLPVASLNLTTGECVTKGVTPFEIHHFQAVLFEDLVYVVCAQTGKFPRETPLECVMIYDPATDEWREGDAIPKNRRRGSAGCALYNDKIYVVSGVIDGHWDGHVTWFDEYDPKSGKWRKLPDAPHARDGFEVAVVGDKLYCVGGRMTRAKTGEIFTLTVPEVDVYDFKSGKWSTLPNKIPTPRAGASTVVVGDKIVVIAGETIQPLAHDECEVLDTKSGEWSVIAPLGYSRHATTAVNVGDAIYIGAGAGLRGGMPHEPTVERLDLTSKITESGWREYDNNRIAISFDGNSAPDNAYKWPIGDPDDWGAAAASCAIMAKLDMQERLVHCSYNNFIDAPAGPDKYNQLKISLEGSFERWRFNKGVLFDVTTQLDLAKEQLADQIIRSTASDPLYFMHAGLSEFVYQVVEIVVKRGHAESLNHLYVLSHSGFNEKEKRRPYHRDWQDIQTLAGGRIKYKKIVDQNGSHDPNVLWNSGENFKVWQWMRDHEDPTVRWMYRRAAVHAEGVADISDCGLLFYLLCGDEMGNPEKFRQFIGDGVLLNE